MAINECAYGSEHPYVGRTLTNLALILLDLGDAAAARPLAERALAIAETVYGPDHPTVASYRNMLAAIVRDLGRTGGE